MEARGRYTARPPPHNLRREPGLGASMGPPPHPEELAHATLAMSRSTYRSVLVGKSD
jgi:hypothetical protein